MLDKINRALRRVPTWVVYLLGTLPLLWIIFETLTGAKKILRPTGHRPIR